MHLSRFAFSTIALCGLLVCGLMSTASAKPRHLVTFDDLVSQFKSVAWEMEISPDGQTLAYSLDTDDSLWLFNPAQGKPHSLGQGIMPRWSPDGKLLAFYSTRSGKAQLWVLDAKSGKMTQITSFHGGIDPDLRAGMSGDYRDALRYCWSPDARKIVFTLQVGITRAAPRQSVDSTTRSGGVARKQLAGAAEPIVLTNNTPPEWMLRGLFRNDFEVSAFTASPAAKHTGLALVRTNQLFIVNIASKQVQQLTKDSQGYFNPDWSTDGTKIVFASTEGRPLEDYGPDTSNIYTIDLATGVKAALTAEAGQKRLPSWSPDGKLIAYVGNKQFEQASVFVLSAKDGNPQNLTAQLDRALSAFTWMLDSKSLVIAYQDGASLPIAQVDLGGRVQTLTKDDALHLPFALSRTGKLIWVQNDGTNAGVIYESDLEGQHARVLLDLNPQIKDWALGEQKVLRWKNSRGDDLEGILITPVGYQEGKSYPLIVDPYPGLANAFMGGPLNGNQAFASRGYAVFFPRERTAHTWENPFQGKAFDQAARGPVGADLMMDDLMSGIDTVVKMGVADPNRMCLYGFSNGGGATNLIVTRTSRFKCAVSLSGVGTDWTASFLLSPETWQKLAGTTPWQDPQAFTTLSPLYHLDKVTTPMLLAGGDKEDTSVVSWLEMYNGLRYLHRDVTLLRYPGQGHGLTGAALRDYWQRVNAFFDKYLNTRLPSAAERRELRKPKDASVTAARPN